MRKTRVLGFALTLAATMVVGSAMGQITTPNYVKVGTTDGDATNHRSFVTLGKTYGFYVEPDALFNPGTTLRSTWVWTIPADVTPSITTPSATAPEGAAINYIELKPTATGTKTISVSEKAAAVFGACIGASKTFDLLVLPVPTFSFTPADGVAVAAAGSCGDISGKKITINLSALDKLNVKFALSKIPVTVDATTGNLVEGTATTVNFVYSKISAGAAQPAQNGDVWSLDGTALANTAAAFDAVTGNQTLKFTCTRDFAAPAASDPNPIVIYRYSIQGDGTDGVNDFVSRKGDFTQASGVFGTEVYYGTAGTVDIYVKKAPKTGPVYHISNNHSN